MEFKLDSTKTNQFVPCYLKHHREDEEECVEEIVRESISSNEDEREEAELKIRERSIDLEQSESQEEKDYKTEFFELLDEVSIPIRYPCVTYILTVILIRDLNIRIQIETIYDGKLLGIIFRPRMDLMKFKN